jgi:hypothetical protein
MDTEAFKIALNQIWSGADFRVGGRRPDGLYAEALHGKLEQPLQKKCLQQFDKGCFHLIATESLPGKRRRLARRACHYARGPTNNGAVVPNVLQSEPLSPIRAVRCPRASCAIMEGTTSIGTI